jgi:hypothetical protein
MKTAHSGGVKTATGVKSAAASAVEATSAAAGICEVRQGARRDTNYGSGQKTYGTSRFTGRRRLCWGNARRPGHASVHVNCSSMSAVRRAAHEVQSRAGTWSGIRRRVKSPLISALIHIVVADDRPSTGPERRPTLQLPAKRKGVEPIASIWCFSITSSLNFRGLIEAWPR